MDSNSTRIVYRGSLTGYRLLTACLLGATLGFIPGFLDLNDIAGGFQQAPGLILSVLALVLILKCNLVVFVLITAITKLLAMQMFGVSYEVGAVLIDGPTASLWTTMINAPFLAWFGLEYYATSGGLVLGPVFGLILFFVLRKLLRKTVPEAEVARQRLGSPVRLVGLGVVVVAGFVLWLSQSSLATGALRGAFQEGMERSNGATVDIAAFNVDLSGGEIVMGGLALADAGDLSRDLLRAETLKMKLGTRALLRKRLVIEEITSIHAQTGPQRTQRGERKYRAPAPEPKPEPGEKTLEDYLKDAEIWKERLAQASEWVESIFRPTAETEAEREKRQEKEKRLRGPQYVVASHRITESPSLLIEKINLASIAVAGKPGKMIDIVATNLSTQPSLVDAPARLEVRSHEKAFGLDLRVSSKTPGVQTSFFYNSIPVDSILSQLGSGVRSMVKGGQLAVSLDGKLDFKNATTWLDLPLKVALQNTTFTVQGAAPTTIEKLEIPLGLRGPLSAPRITIDDSKFADALLAAGKAELANQLRKQADKLLGDKVPENVKGAVKDLVSGKGLDAAKKVADDAAAKAAEEAKNKAAAAAKKKEDELKQKAADAAEKARKELEQKANKGLQKVFPFSVERRGGA